MNAADGVRAALAALVAQVMRHRYPSQPFGESNKQDWLRAALESDPIVLLEAAWEWWRDHLEGKFRPGPGQLRQLSAAWTVDPQPYVGLPEAMDAEETPGLAALIERFGRAAWDELDRMQILPSQETRWNRVNQEHRRYIFAKERMSERGAPPWNPAESGPIMIAAGHMAALTSPLVANENHTREFNARIQALTSTKRLK